MLAFSWLCNRSAISQVVRVVKGGVRGAERFVGITVVAIGDRYWLQTAVAPRWRGDGQLMLVTSHVMCLGGVGLGCSPFFEAWNPRRFGVTKFSEPRGTGDLEDQASS